MNRIFTTNILFPILYISAQWNSFAEQPRRIFGINHSYEMFIGKIYFQVIHSPCPFTSWFSLHRKLFWRVPTLCRKQRAIYIKLLLRVQKLCSNTNYKLPLKTDIIKSYFDNLVTFKNKIVLFVYIYWIARFGKG